MCYNEAERRLIMSEESNRRTLTCQDIIDVTDEASDVLPILTTRDFACAILGILCKHSIKEFETYPLTMHIVREFQNNEAMRALMFDIDPTTIIHDGVSFLTLRGQGEYVLYGIPRVRFRLSRKEANFYVEKIHPVYRELIENMMYHFLHPELINAQKLERKL